MWHIGVHTGAGAYLYAGGAEIGHLGLQHNLNVKKNITYFQQKSAIRPWYNLSKNKYKCVIEQCPSKCMTTYDKTP